MSDAAAAPSKVCVVCGVDVADKPRVKDATGRYMCKACAEKQTAAKPATAGPRAASKPAGPRPAGPKSASDKGAIPLDSPPGYDPVMAALVATSAQATSQACPNCKGWVKEGQLLCTSCGFNLEEGKQIRTRVQKERTVKERKARSGPMVPEAFAPLLWIGGACAGSAIGAAIWYYIASAEVLPRKAIGLAAIAIGILSGLGATAAARNTAGMGSGIVAVLAAVLAICVGRYFAFRQMLDSWGLAGMPFEEWYFDSFSIGELVGIGLAIVAAWKAGSTGLMGGESD